jgi:hypothetical protein
MNAACIQPGVVGDGGTNQADNVQDNSDDDSPQDRGNGNKMHEMEQPEQPEKPRRKRGRIAKDPLNETFLFECRDVDDLEIMLRDFLKSTTSPPEHTTVEFRFPSGAAFMVYPPGHSQAIKDPLQRIFSKKAVSVVEALQPTCNPKDQIEKQRSIAKICVETIGKADGFKYGFNNNWISKEDGASRFSYFCNDSSLNKARAGNPAASNRVAHKKGQKPVYECEGTIAVKFWASKQMLEVLYKHIPCHETYAARAPIPRKGTRRRLLMEVFEPAKLPAPKIPGGQRNEVRCERRTERLASHSGVRSCSDIDGTGSVPPDPMQKGLYQSSESASIAISASEEPQLFPAEKLKELQNSRQKTRQISKKRKPRISNISETMSGLIEGEEIRMAGERPNKKQATAKTTRKSKHDIPKQPAIIIDDDDGMAAPIYAEQAAPSAQPSEIEILKAKLAQAEQQIKRLEAEKSSPARPPPQPYYYVPPGYYPPPPPQYQYPSQQQG